MDFSVIRPKPKHSNKTYNPTPPYMNNPYGYTNQPLYDNTRSYHEPPYGNNFYPYGNSYEYSHHQNYPDGNYYEPRYETLYQHSHQYCGRSLGERSYSDHRPTQPTAPPLHLSHPVYHQHADPLYWRETTQDRYFYQKPSNGEYSSDDQPSCCSIM